MTVRPIPRPAILAGFAALAIISGVVAYWFRSEAVPPDGPPAADAADRADHWEAVLLGRTYLKSGRPDLALQQVIEVRDEGPGAGEAMAVAGLALVELNQMKDARLALERALKLQPRQPRAAKVLAAVYLSQGDGTRGLHWLEHAAKLDPRDARPWMAMGKVYHDLGEIDKSADAYTKAVERTPQDLEARVALAGELLEANRAEEAGPVIEAGLAQAPDEPRLLGLAARHAYAISDLETARARSRRALEIDPDGFDARIVRAQIARQELRPADALPDLLRAVELKPDDLGALQALAQIQAQLGDREASARTAGRHRGAQQRALKMDQLTREITARPDDPAPRVALGEVALEGRLYELALQCFRAALDLDPEHPTARRSLETLLAEHPDLAAPADVPLP